MVNIDTSISPQKLYIQAENRVVNYTDSINKASDFYIEFSKQINNLATVKPEKLFNRFQGINNNKTRINGNIGKSALNIVGNIIHNVKEPIGRHEQTAYQFLLGKASLIDLSIAATESKNTIDIIVKIRDKFLEAIDKLMNINI